MIEMVRSNGRGPHWNLVAFASKSRNIPPGHVLITLANESMAPLSDQ
jgi:hypothetical protein